MKTHTLRFPFTSVAVVIAIMVLLGAIIGDVNFIELPVGLVARIEQHEIDDIVMTFLFVFTAFIVDQVVAARRAKHEVSLQIERLRVVKVTMRSVQDIVNNSLNQLQLIRVEAEGHVSQDVLTLFDGTIQETAEKLREPETLKSTLETQMAEIGLAMSVLLIAYAILVSYVHLRRR